MSMKTRITSNRITELRPDEIFVFGSNLEGAHGGGAAYLAWKKWGAIKPYVDEFIRFAKEHSQYTFLVTEIGCGIAGFAPKEIAPLFKEAANVPNIHLPQRFWHVLNAK